MNARKLNLYTFHFSEIQFHFPDILLIFLKYINRAAKGTTLWLNIILIYLNFGCFYLYQRLTKFHYWEHFKQIKTSIIALKLKINRHENEFHFEEIDL